MKKIFAPHLNSHVILGGRKRPDPSSPKLYFNRYLRMLKLPSPPASLDLSPAGITALRKMYLNDQYGDCVIAGEYHGVGVETGNAGKIFVASDAQILGDYEKIGNFNPKDPSTDQGCDEQTAMNFWEKNGLANGTKPLGRLVIDATNKLQIQLALWLFENQLFGIELPDSWVDPMPSADGFVWDTDTPDPDNGHCVQGYGFDATGVKIATWALLGKITYGAMANLCVPSAGGELYAQLTPDVVNKAMAKAPNGLDWRTLITDFDSMSGQNIPVPAPSPTPTPPAPAPVPPAPKVTLAQVQAWLTTELVSLYPAVTDAVCNNLAKHWSSSVTLAQAQMWITIELNALYPSVTKSVCSNLAGHWPK